MAHGDAQEGKWRGKSRMEWVASTLHTTSEHGVSSITTADAQTSAASSRLNWRPRRFKWTRPFRLKTQSGFCACVITFQTQSTNNRTVLFQGDACAEAHFWVCSRAGFPQLQICRWEMVWCINYIKLSDATDSVKTLWEVIERKAINKSLVLIFGARAVNIQKIRPSR